MKADLCIIKRQAMTISFFHFLANYWARLGLIGYKEEVRMLLFDETVNMLNVEDLQNVNPDKLDLHLVNPFKDVQGDYKTAVKFGLLSWIEWDKETLRIYQDIYQSDASEKLMDLMDKVAEHIVATNNKIVKLQAVDFDYKYIAQMQPKIRTKILEKMHL